MQKHLLLLQLHIADGAYATPSQNPLAALLVAHLLRASPEAETCAGSSFAKRRMPDVLLVVRLYAGEYCESDPRNTA